MFQKALCAFWIKNIFFWKEVMINTNISNIYVSIYPSIYLVTKYLRHACQQQDITLEAAGNAVKAQYTPVSWKLKLAIKYLNNILTLEPQWKILTNLTAQKLKALVQAKKIFRTNCKGICNAYDRQKTNFLHLHCRNHSETDPKWADVNRKFSEMKADMKVVST